MNNAIDPENLPDEATVKFTCNGQAVGVHSPHTAPQAAVPASGHGQPLGNARPQTRKTALLLLLLPLTHFFPFSAMCAHTYQKCVRTHIENVCAPYI